jgi:hypothetical protein
MEQTATTEQAANWGILILFENANRQITEDEQLAY